MPYKDPEQQRKCVRESVRKYRDKNVITPKERDVAIEKMKSLFDKYVETIVEGGLDINYQLEKFENYCQMAIKSLDLSSLQNLLFHKNVAVYNEKPTGNFFCLVKYTRAKSIFYFDNTAEVQVAISENVREDDIKYIRSMKTNKRFFSKEQPSPIREYLSLAKYLSTNQIASYRSVKELKEVFRIHRVFAIKQKRIYFTIDTNTREFTDIFDQVCPTDLQMMEELVKQDGKLCYIPAVFEKVKSKVVMKPKVTKDKSDVVMKPKVTKDNDDMKDVITKNDIEKPKEVHAEDRKSKRVAFLQWNYEYSKFSSPEEAREKTGKNSIAYFNKGKRFYFAMTRTLQLRAQKEVEKLDLKCVKYHLWGFGDDDEENVF